MHRQSIGIHLTEQAIVEILSSLPGCGALEVRLGHRALYEAALRHIATPRELRGAVAKLLATAAAVSPLNPTARGRRWPSIRYGLQLVLLPAGDTVLRPLDPTCSIFRPLDPTCSLCFADPVLKKSVLCRSGLEGLGLDEAAVSRCKALVLQAPGEAAAALHRLRASAGIGGRAAFVPPTACLDDLQVVHSARCTISSAVRGSSYYDVIKARRLMTGVVKEVQVLLKHLATWGVTAWNIILDPLLLPHAEYFSGLTFQAHLVQSDSGAASLVAVGAFDAVSHRLVMPF